MGAVALMTPAQIIACAHTVSGVNCRGDLHGSLCGQICSAIESAVNAEMHLCAAKVEALRNEAAEAASRARAKGDQRTMIQAGGAAHMAWTARQAILLPADGCRTCMNERLVPSALMPGQMTRCPVCAPQARAGA